MLIKMIYATIHSSHIEKPSKSFYVSFYRPRYFNVYWHEGGYRTVKVLADTSEGALKIAKYHWRRGKEFKLVDGDPDE